ncbi:MAG: arginase family protein [Acidobacteria bacterium]|nr:arginase family protein [Acidobacteriota bacterium]
MAVKIIRQPKKIVLIGAPTSAGAHMAGVERAPAALRAAGLAEKLTAAGFEVSDAGDIPVFTFQVDEESPRARNIVPVLAALNALKPHVEVAAKSGALPIVLGGDCTVALGTISGVRRYFPNTSLVYVDRHADLNTPATTPSGIFDGMVVAHIAGRGAAELVRFWGEPPLVREPDVTLFGIQQLDPGEKELLERSPIRNYTLEEVHRRGAAAAATHAMDRLHATNRTFVLHFDVDSLAGEEFTAANFTAPGGLPVEEARAALEVFFRQPNLGAVNVTQYNPEKDADGSGARLVVDLLVASLSVRLASTEIPAAPAESESAPAVETPAAETPAAETSSPEASPASADPVA